jgi:D-arabinose 1-dehydrogenase-like Zn-dependent alcohol dehydrogenase
MGSRAELEQVVQFCTDHDLHPPIGALLPLAETPAGLQAMADGDVFGKIVITTR